MGLSSKVMYIVTSLTSLIALYEHFIVLARMHNKMKKQEAEEIMNINSSRASDGEKDAKIQELKTKIANRDRDLAELFATIKVKTNENGELNSDGKQQNATVERLREYFLGVQQLASVLHHRRVGDSNPYGNYDNPGDPFDID